MHCSGLSSTAFKLLKSNSEIDSNASISMQQGINITTDFFFKKIGRFILSGLSAWTV